MPIFAQGVPRNKLTLLYYIQSSKLDITKEQLYRAMVENELMSYFDFESCMHELEEDAFVLAVPRAFGVTGPASTAAAMEIGIHNTTVAMTIAIGVLGSVELAVPAAVYSVVMYIVAALFGTVLVRTGINRAPADAAAAPEDPVVDPV